MATRRGLPVRLKRTAAPGSEITLDATGSSDPDHNELAYEWQILPDENGLTEPVEIRNAKAKIATLLVPNALSMPVLRVCCRSMTTARRRWWRISVRESP